MKITEKKLRLLVRKEIESIVSENDDKDQEKDDSRKNLGKYAQKILDVLDKFDDEEARRLELLLKDALDSVQPPDLPPEIDTETVKG